MKRREFITLLGGAAAWPLAARAQQGDRGNRVRRIGVLVPYDENARVQESRISAFRPALADLWTGVRMDVRWAGTDVNRIQAIAQDLVGRQPDIILTGGTAATAPMIESLTSI